MTEDADLIPLGNDLIISKLNLGGGTFIPVKPKEIWQSWVKYVCHTDQEIGPMIILFNIVYLLDVIILHDQTQCDQRLFYAYLDQMLFKAKDKYYN